MNDATPRWRSFSSDAATPSPPEGTPAPAEATPTASDRRRWLLPILAGLGGLVAGVAVVALALVTLATPTLSSLAVDVGEPLSMPSRLSETTSLPAPSTALVVDVAGAVARPGLHRLDAGARVGDAILAAGGYAPRADLTAASLQLNLAQPLEDGAKVLVPQLSVDRISAPAPVDDGRIDLNTAGQSELESLPGIGPVTAGKIIDARESRRFGAVRDLRSRSIVGESVFADIKSLVRAD